MPVFGFSKRKGTCAICNKVFPEDSPVYFDPSRAQGHHLVHQKCYDDLMKNRGPRAPEKKFIRRSVEELAPPF